MTPPLAPADRQALWWPTWVFAGPSFPHAYAIRDVSVPGVTGTAFTIGESAVGDTHLIGGGAGPDALHAWGRIIGTPTVTRRITDPLYQLVEKADVSVTIADPDHELTSDFRAAPFTLARYDAVSGVQIYEGQFLVTQTTRDRDRVTVAGKSLDLAILEERIPGVTIDSVMFPFADPSALGQTPPWVFGCVRNLPLPNVTDNVLDGDFDYVLSIGEDSISALLALRRLARNPDDPAQASFDIAFDELEPYPGEDGVLLNGTLEDWSDAATATGWTLAGAGATLAKNTTAGQVDEGSASASITRVGTNMNISQDLVLNATTLGLSWWRDREITVTARVRATVAATVNLRVNDGVSAVFDSTFHTGSGLFEDLVVGTASVPCVLNTAATQCLVIIRIITTNQTAQVDNVRVYLRAKSWAEIPRPELYPGYTAIRFFLRQEDASGALYPIVADVNGPQSTRNPIRAARAILTTAEPLGCGRTVDAVSFDAAEIAACVTYEDAVRLDDPEVFFPFRDPVPDKTVADVVMHDRSGHERHGFIINGGPGIPLALGGPCSDEVTPNVGVFTNYDDASLALPAAGFGGTAAWVSSSPAFSGQAITCELWLQIYAGNLPDAGDRPIVEKLVGATQLSGYGIYRDNDQLIFFVRGVDTVLYSVTSNLVDVTDEGRWMHLVGVATGNVLTLYRDGVLVATGSYTGLIAEGDGRVMLGEFGTGALVGIGRDWIDNVALYATALSAARIAAHSAAGTVPAAEPIVTYHQALGSFSTEFHYMLSEAPGSGVMHDSSGNAHNGTFVGTPLLAVPGPLNPERGYTNGWGGMRLANTVAQYAVETGMTLADAAGAVAVFYAPAAEHVAAGIVEKTIGGVRGTQWGFCQRIGQDGIGFLRFTLVTSGGTFLVDAPLVRGDKGRYMHLVATWGSGTIEVYKNYVLAASGTYTGTPSSGVGDFYIGVQGTSGAGLTRPGIGDFAQVSYTPVHWTADTVAFLGVAATWYNGGLLVDVALREARQAQEWLKQFCLVAAAQLDVTPTGAITCATRLANPATIQHAARDGAGDGDRNIVRIGGRVTPRLDDTVRDLVLRYRPDLLTGEFLATARRAVSTTTDAFGRRIGRKKVVTLDAVREPFTADRVVDRLGKRMKAADDRVRVTFGQDARRLREAQLVQVTDAHMGYADTVLETEKVDKRLETIDAEAVGWDELANTYAPGAFPADAAPG